ncbi:MAG: hypothetical protein OEU95_01250 [Nitrospirota bacterium]|nr:hypothetical protein [Nitrospirota bacterium]
MLKDQTLLSKIKSKLFHRNKHKKYIFFRKPVYFNRHPQCDFLITATGPSLGKHQKEIQKFIDKKKPGLKIIVCNYDGGMFKSDYRIIVNRRRFHTFFDSSKSETLLLSCNFPRWMIRKRIGNRHFEDVMFKNTYFSDTGVLEIDKKGIIYTKAGTLATIALGTAIVMGAKNIYFAGLDGFSMYQPEDIHFFNDNDSIPFDSRLMQEKATNDMLEQAAKIIKERGGELKVITPTVYKAYYDNSILEQ